MEYEEFIKTKEFQDVRSGFEPDAINPKLFDFQQAIVTWALRRGRAAIFANTGMGKTAMQMEWADNVVEHTGKPVLVVAPLAVAKQSVGEATKFDITAQYVREQPSAAFAQIYVTNYEMLDKFDLTKFSGIVLDESSIIKNRDGKTRKFIIESCQRIPYRLSCTATPSPNDYMELGNQAEFLGVMGMNEMLAMFFTHDGGDTSKWRLKGHGERKFWEWMATWAVTITKPSDIGYSSEGYDLPPLNMHEHMVKSPESETGLFVDIARTLNERRKAKKDTLGLRVEETKNIVLNVFCDKLTEIISQDAEYAVETGVRRESPTEDARRSGVSRESKATVKAERSGGPQAIHERVLPEESEQMEEERSEEASGAQQKTEREIRQRQRIQGLDKEKGFRVAIEKSGRKKESEDPEVWPNDGSVQGSDGDRPVSVSDMRTLGHFEEEVFSGNRSLPSIRESARSALHELQYGDWEVSRFSRIIGSRDSVLKALPKFLIWCHTNDEHRALESAFRGLSLSVKGPDKMDHKESAAGEWMDGPVPIMISKPSIFGHGMNWQHCQNMAFVGLDDSYEQMYQAIRRCWRFGQTKPVDVHIITAEALGAIKANIQRKENQMEQMQLRMVEHMQDAMQKEIKGAAMIKDNYDRQVYEGRDFTVHNADCVHLAREIPDNSVGYTIFSPPFASLYTYSNSDYDMGNAKDDGQFYEQFRFLVDEMYRITKPGRLLSFHCMNLPTSKQNDGYIGIRDFRGELIKMFQDAGWIYHSEVCIWKDPVTAMQRTKALGLLHKTIRKDSAMSRQGIPDFLVTMRKPGDNDEPISHTHEEFPVQLWQKYASPVWMDINPSRTLNYREGRDEDDERHICPLQLDVIERGLELWSKPGDLVFSPFTGIGSEGYCAVKAGRKFIGSELKASYYELAIKNIESAYNTTMDMFAEETA